MRSRLASPPTTSRPDTLTTCSRLCADRTQSTPCWPVLPLRPGRGRSWLDAQWAKTTAAAINAKSPTSLKIALAQMRRGKAWSFAQCMKAEFRIVSRIVYGHDFYEGVRAVIIDKDNRP